MGNAVSPATRVPAGAIDSYVAELGTDIVYDKSVGESRFLKSVKGKHRNGPLLIKVFIKPDPALTLRTYHGRLNAERDTLSDIPNVYNYQVFAETDRAGYIIRQWVSSNLYDRISTRPFLSSIEKKWIAFQILVGMRDARTRKASHGDIRLENILVTSWNWVYITDFASNTKPTYLPLDDPADFAFFYDNSGRRACYIAPERFYEAGGEIDKKKADLDFYKRDGIVSEEMDVFAVGCAIAELFMEGVPTFTLSQLFKYRAKELNIESHLAAIEDPAIKALVLQMIALDPDTRPSFDSVLENARNVAFPESFYSFFHRYLSSFNELSSPSPFAVPVPAPTPAPTGAPPPQATPANPNAVDTPPEGAPLPSNCNSRIESIWQDLETVIPYFGSGDEQPAPLRPIESANLRTLQDVFPVEVHIPQLQSTLPNRSESSVAAEDGTALLILSLVCSNLRYCSHPSYKLKGLDILLAISRYLTDEAKLDRLVPYLVDLTQDEAAIVRAAALRTILQVVTLVNAITPANAGIFPEYIIPNTRHLATDPDVSVRCVYAQCIVPLADSSVRYLEMAQAMKAHGTYKFGAGNPSPLDDVSYDSSMAEIQTLIQETLLSLLADRSSVVRRAVLHNISSLCVFFGRQKSNDLLLSHMITYLNDRDWLLRYAFFQSIVDVAVCVGGRSLDEYILPLMMQSLSDVEESVVAQVLQAFTSLAELGLFQKTRIWELMNAILGLVYHPNIWIRQASVSFLVSAGQNLPTTDVWCILYPALRYFLRSDIEKLDEIAVLSSLKPSIPRPLFDAVVNWAKRGDKTQFWKLPQNRNRTVSRAEAVRESLASLKRSVSLTLRGAPGRSEDDDQQIQRLYQMGMTAAEENKVLAMRDHISKLADARSSSLIARLEADSEAEVLRQTSTISLQKLGIIPNTIFPNAYVPVAVGRHPLSSRASSFAETMIVSPGPMTPMTPRAQDRLRDASAIDDLRRKLAAFDGSTTSLNSIASPTPRHHERRDSLGSQAARSPMHDRSPPESVASGEPVGYRRHPGRRLQLSSESKAPALVGSIRANAVGLLEAPAPVALRAVHEDAVTSGRSSPVSQLGTLRGINIERKVIVAKTVSSAGDDPAVHHLLEHMNLENGREGMQDFGPRVSEGVNKRRTNVRTPLHTREGNTRKGDVTLVANLTAHSGPINGLAVSPDHLFFVSCSDDKTVRVWDTARLERNVTSKPRHVYTQHHAKVTAVCTIENTYCFASAGDDGSLHVVRVHVSQSGSMPKYSKVSIVREHRVDHPGEYITCLTHYNTDTSSNLLYATTHGAVTILDIRTMRVLQQLDDPLHFGGITAMCVDKKRTWLVTGTLSGMLVLWDLRFGILLRSWKVGAALQPGVATRVHACRVHPVNSHWIVVSSETRPSPGDLQGTVLVEIWDIEQGQLVETLGTREASKPTHGQDATVAVPNFNTTSPSITQSPADAIAMLVHSRGKENGASATEEIASDRRVWQPDVRAIVTGVEFGGQPALPTSTSTSTSTVKEGYVLTGGGRSSSQEKRGKAGIGFVITGSEDRKLRLWHLGVVERSMLISGGDLERPNPSFSTIRGTAGETSSHLETWPHWQEATLDRGKNTYRSRLIGQHQQTLLKVHQDCISALCCIDSPFKGGIVSGDRSGVLKVFRVTLGEE